MLRSQHPSKHQQNLQGHCLGLMFKLKKHVDLIAAKFAAEFVD